MKQPAVVPAVVDGGGLAWFVRLKNRTSSRQDSLRRPRAPCPCVRRDYGGWVGVSTTKQMDCLKFEGGGAGNAKSSSVFCFFLYNISLRHIFFYCFTVLLPLVCGPYSCF